MDEFEIIRHYFERAVSDDSIRVGIGDDGAVLRPDPGRDLITVIDTLISDVHFPPSLPPADIGYRSVAVNLSDIAAMAGRPRWMVLALTLSDSDPAWLAGFSSGLFAAAQEFRPRPGWRRYNSWPGNGDQHPDYWRCGHRPGACSQRR